MRVLIADKFEACGQTALKGLGCEVLFEPALKDQALVKAVAEKQPDVLIVRSTKVSKAVLEAGTLKLIVRAGAGYNTIDVATASRRGTYVANCPGKNAVAVAELAFALILALDRRVADNVIALRKGEWNKSEFSSARGLYGRTLGLIGLGRIGSEMIPRARAFGMPVVACSRSLTPERAEALGITHAASLEDVARAADVVSVHLALNADTKGCLSASFFGSMKEGACFINTSRGDIVDQPALLAAIKKRKLRVGSDVYADEPASGKGDFTDPLGQDPNVYGTHHIGASTAQAQEAIAAEAVRVVQTFKETGKVPNVVNLAQRTPATHALVVRHLDRPGVLAGILDALRTSQINVQEMENIVFEGAEAAVAHINLDQPAPDKLLEECRKADSNILELTLLPIDDIGAC
jgi:D-3-phosphoglycerate dehydrogenase